MAQFAFLEQLRRPRAFPPKISFYASVKPIATFSPLRQRACGSIDIYGRRQRAIRWHRLVKRHRYTDHEY